MKAAGYGKIVNISSTAALQGYTNFGAYPVSKAAVITITRGLARELGPYNITANTVAPGGTMSADEPTAEGLAKAERDVNEPARPGVQLRGVQVRSIRRVERPDDLVGGVIYLLSAESDFVTGQTLVIDGGAYML
jgi:3-oxoacyl-[acyl-carrier protein] reductase